MCVYVVRDTFTTDWIQRRVELLLLLLQLVLYAVAVALRLVAVVAASWTLNASMCDLTEPGR